MKFRCTTCVHALDDHGAIWKFKGQIRADREDGSEILGEFRAERLLVGLCLNLGHELLPICDADSQEWLECYDTFFQDNEYRDVPQLHDCCTDMVLIFDVSIEPRFKAPGLKLAVVQRLIDTVGAECCLVAYLLDDKQAELPELAGMGFKAELSKKFAHLNLAYNYRRVISAQPADGELCRYVLQPVDPELDD